MAANYNYFEGLTIRNTNVAFLLGIKDIAGSSGFTLKHSKIYNVGRAMQDDWSGSKNYYIADNSFVGRHDPDKMMSWIGAIWEKFPGFPELLTSEYAIKVYGQGHVVAHNYLAHWHDAIDVATYGNPDGSPNPIPDRLPVSIDIYGNDIFNMGDNCIESDGGAHNIRVFRNRCFNVASQALSAQPMYGGPVYFYQNLVYNAPASGVAEVRRDAGRRARLQQHVRRRRERARAGEQRPLPQQPDRVAGGSRSGVRRRHVHELLDVRLQRVPARIPARPARSSGISPARG